MRRPTRSPFLPLAAAALALGGLAGCGDDDTPSAGAESSAAKSSIPSVPQPRFAGDEVTVENCGKPVTLPSPAERIFANDGNIISITLAVGAAKQIVAASSFERDRGVLARHYGQEVVDGLDAVSAEYPSKESVLAKRPDVFFAGYNYGFDETTGLTPEGLAKFDVDAYALTESCRQDKGAGKGSARGIVEPWTALRTDLTNVGAFTGHGDRAKEVITDIDTRLEALRSAPKPEKAPVVFLFDSGSKSIFTSGNLGAPQAIIDAAGARNALEDLDDTWTEVSWEQLVTAKPDAFVFVDYPPQTVEQKIAMLEKRAGVKDLPAVKERRFLNLPYALWTSGPLNIDAAEHMRASLESWNLVPKSGITPKFEDAIPID